jgi:hypothetical protein
MELENRKQPDAHDDNNMRGERNDKDSEKRAGRRDSDTDPQPGFEDGSLLSTNLSSGFTTPENNQDENQLLESAELQAAHLYKTDPDLHQDDSLTTNLSSGYVPGGGTPGQEQNELLEKRNNYDEAPEAGDGTNNGADS